MTELTGTSTTAGPQRSSTRSNSDRTADHPVGGAPTELMAETHFMQMLHIEQKRTERSRRRFILMLMDCSKLFNTSRMRIHLDDILLALSNSKRETDIQGWYKKGSVVGVIFTEISAIEPRNVITILREKVTGALLSTLDAEKVTQIELSFHTFPDDWHDDGDPGGPTLGPKAVGASNTLSALATKRAMDIIGSLFAIVLFAPLLLVIAVAVKLTSKGPILFRQQRIGQGGKAFAFLKFRSMYSDNNHSIHQEFARQFITGEAGQTSTIKRDDPVYKLTARSADYTVRSTPPKDKS